MEMKEVNWATEMCKIIILIIINKITRLNKEGENKNKIQKKVVSLKMTTKCSIHCKCNELNFLFPHCKTLCMFPCIPPVNGCSRPGASCHVM